MIEERKVYIATEKVIPSDLHKSSRFMFLEAYSFFPNDVLPRPSPNMPSRLNLMILCEFDPAAVNYITIQQSRSCD